jgi:hypothetical protein
MFTAAVAVAIFLGAIFRTQLINVITWSTPIERRGERLAKRMRKRTFYAQRYDEWGQWIDAGCGVFFAAKYNQFRSELRIRVEGPSQERLRCEDQEGPWWKAVEHRIALMEREYEQAEAKRIATVRRLADE